ncbi:flavin reductase family protein [Flavobacterium sp.]|uniref:flavin reductase family protein n=1 Tax=Flavobacterium sp. TaxID=239 RepID=UPI003BEE32B3
MEFNPDNLDSKAIYKLLTGSIIPRPIAWIATISEEGINNLAPFSYFNMAGDDPPHVMFSTRRDNNSNKDTLNNVLVTNQFVVNMVTEELTEQMNRTAQAVPAEVDEFQMVGVTPIPSSIVKPMRVKESLVQFECEMVHHYFLEDHIHGGSCIVIGRVVSMHFDESILIEDHKINMETYKPIARLSGSNYSKIGEVFSIKRS